MAPKRSRSRVKSSKPQELTNWTRITQGGHTTTVWHFERLNRCVDVVAKTYVSDFAWPSPDPFTEREQASKNHFNPHHIHHILIGFSGPWHVPRFPIPRLTLALPYIEYAALEPTAAELRNRKRDKAHNASLNSLKSHVKAAPLDEETRDKILGEIQQGWRPSSRKFLYAPALGVTIGPGRPLAKHRVWQWCILHLVQYLLRTLRVTPSECFDITARILHAVSDGQYPDRPQRVRTTYYEGMRQHPLPD
jgi:hypothetical protein